MSDINDQYFLFVFRSAGLVQKFGVIRPPIDHLAVNLPEGIAFLGDGIFDPGRDFRVNLAVNQAVFFHFPQLQGQDAPGDAGNLALQLAKPAELVGGQVVDDEQFPLAAHHLEDLADDLNALASSALEGSALYAEFEAILKALQRLGFFPKQELVSAVARSMIGPAPRPDMQADSMA